jgi:hypothetical protein
MLGAPPIIVGATGGWYGGTGATGGWYGGAGAAMSVASAGGWGGGAGGCMPKSVIFGKTIVSLPVGRGGSLPDGAEAGAGGVLCSIREPQFPQNRSSALTSL